MLLGRRTLCWVAGGDAGAVNRLLLLHLLHTDQEGHDLVQDTGSLDHTVIMGTKPQSAPNGISPILHASLRAAAAAEQLNSMCGRVGTGRDT